MSRFQFEESLLFAIVLGFCAANPAFAQSTSSSKLSVHLIETYSAGSSNIVAGKPRVLKVLANYDRFPDGMLQAMRDYKAKAPNGAVVLRVWSPKNYSLTDDPTASASDFWTNAILPPLNSISSSDRALIDYLEGPNEGETPTLGYPSSPAGSQWFNQFWTNLTPLMVSAGYKPCLGSIAVGNPNSVSDLDPFIPALRQAKAAGGAWSYHAYTINYVTDVGVEYWYSLRYRQYYSYFAQSYPDLSTLPMILTEGGVDLSGNPDTSGWQARGTAEQYERWLNWFDGQMKQDSYVVGCTLFQNGDPTGWQSFTLEPIAGWLGNYLKSPTTWPGPPSGVNATVTNNTVLITWTNVSATPTTYAVKRSTASGGPYTLLAQNITEGMPITSFTDNTPVNGTTYYYVVTAVNAIAESDNSSEVSVTPGWSASLPATPANLTATSGSGNISLTWSPSAGAISYNVKRSLTSGGSYSIIATNVFQTSYLDVSYTVGTPYYYVVSAVNNIGESAVSAQASATPTGALPDAIVTAITWSPSNFYPGTNVLFTATVKNQGAAPTPNGVQIGVGFSVDGVGGFWSVLSGPLQAGASMNLTANGGSFNWAATPGSHVVTAVVDDINRFAEGNENNNVLSVPFVTLASSYAVNCGGSATGTFSSDAPFTSALSVDSVTNTINLSSATNPAPATVYQCERWRPFTSLFPNLPANALYKVRLHFAEISPFVAAAGDRRFNISINGAQVLTNFDLIAATGSKFRATTRQFNATTDSSGQISVQFLKGAAGEPTCSGIEIFPYTNTPPLLARVPDIIVAGSNTVLFTNTATDADIPADTLTFSLLYGPAGTAVNPTTGVLTWTAPTVTTPQTNFAAVQVTDNGSPAKTSTRTFSLIAIPLSRISSATMTNGTLSLTWSAFPGRTYRIQYKNDLNDATWLPLGSDTIATDYSVNLSDTPPANRQRFYRLLQVN